MRKIHNKISLIKMDIEGAEYDLIKNTTAKDWSNVNAIALELHCDPAKQMSKRHFLNKFDSFGFRATRGPYIPYMLQRY